MPSKTPAEQHEHNILKFPEGFLWGCATSAYQVEGGNNFSDWGDAAGDACDQYNRYETDFDLAKSLNQNAHRLSIEWSRIEPKDGQFDQSAIDHYKSVLKALKDRGFTVMLTLWHFTLPKWVTDAGGWENSQTPNLFERFVKKIVPEIGEYVDLWVTINEPGVYMYETYIQRVWPNAKKSFFGQIKTYLNLASAHRRAYKYLHSIYPAGKPVGIANNVMSFSAFHKHSIVEQFAVYINDLFTNHLFYFLTRKTHDFLGINYYFHARFRHRGLLPESVYETPISHEVSDLGWEIYPEGIYDALTDLSDDIPIYITECGIASTNDDRRNRFLITYLSEVARAIKSGCNVRGFFYWSLLDNFEWHRGFDPRFGLIEVDYATQKRIPRPSAKVYAEIIKNNGIPHKLLRFIGHTVTAQEVLERMKR